LRANANAQCDGESKWNTVGHTNSYGYSDSNSDNCAFAHTFSDAMRGHAFERELRWGDGARPARGLGGDKSGPR
jgi:hypothetical protein